MFKFVDNDACTLSLYFVDESPFVCGEIRTFNKETYKDTRTKWVEMMAALKQEEYSHVFSQVDVDQENIINFEKRYGFKILANDNVQVLLAKEL